MKCKVLSVEAVLSAYTRARALAHTHACAQAGRHAHTHILTHMHTHTHTHTHANANTLSAFQPFTCLGSTLTQVSHVLQSKNKLYTNQLHAFITCCRFPSIFAGQLATKGSWGAAHRYHMYSPDNVSVSHGSESSGEGQLLKGRRQGRTDFQDSPWYDNRGGATPSALSSPRRDRDARGE